MGNKQSDSKSNNNNKVDGNNDDSTNKHVDNDTNLFLDNLHKLPLELSPEEFDLICRDLKRTTFEVDTYVLEEGERANGIYFIIQGGCAVQSNNFTVNEIDEHNFFGEISCIYNKECTCSVITTQKSDMFVLDHHILMKYMHNGPNIELKDWYIQQKYIDTCDLFDEREISAKVIMDNMLKSHLFHDWSTDALSYIYNTITAKNYMIYPANSFVFSKDYKDGNCYLLINGSIQVYFEDQIITELKLETDECFLFGDEQLFLNHERHISIKTKSLCHIVVIQVESFQNLSERYPIEFSKLLSLSYTWKQCLRDRVKYFDQVFYGFIDIIAMIISLKKVPLFKMFSNSTLFTVAANCELIILEKDKNLLAHNLDINYKFDSIVVLYGNISISSSDDCERSLSSLELFKVKDEYSAITATSKCVLVIIRKQQMSDTIISVSDSLTVVDI